jgi:hypothetical protein
MNDPTQGNWGSSGDSPLGGSSNGAAPSYGPGFQSYLQDRLNRLGKPRHVHGRGAVYSNGRDSGQEEAAAMDDYSNLSDEDRKRWEGGTSQPSAPAATTAPAAKPATAAASTPTASPAPVTPAPTSQPATYQGPDTDFGADADQGLSRLRAAGLVGANETVTDPARFKSMLASLDSQRAAFDKANPTIAPQPREDDPYLAGTGLDFKGAGVDISRPVQPAQPAQPAPTFHPTLPTPATPPPVIGGTINGQPGEQVVAQIKSANAQRDAQLGGSVPPVLATKGSYAGPTPPGADDEEDPTKKRPPVTPAI